MRINPGMLQNTAKKTAKLELKEGQCGTCGRSAWEKDGKNGKLGRVALSGMALALWVTWIVANQLHFFKSFIGINDLLEFSAY